MYFGERILVFCTTYDLLHHFRWSLVDRNLRRPITRNQPPLRRSLPTALSQTHHVRWFNFGCSAPEVIGLRPDQRYCSRVDLSRLRQSQRWLPKTPLSHLQGGRILWINLHGLARNPHRGTEILEIAKDSRKTHQHKAVAVAIRQCACLLKP